ncbi:putative transposase Tn3 family protein [Streptomyces sp. Tu6071]|nr:putative transposase Tn3 family protein [Streptomyces sp. Tu6071]
MRRRPVTPGCSRPRPRPVRACPVSQRTQGAGGRDAGGEAVAAEQVQVAVLERGQTGNVLVADLVALGAELGDGDVEVLRRPQHNAVEDQARHPSAPHCGGEPGSRSPPPLPSTSAPRCGDLPMTRSGLLARSQSAPRSRRSSAVGG